MKSPAVNMEHNRDGQTFSISTVARKLEVSRYRIVYWKKSGLLLNSENLISFEELRLIQFIVECKKKKISIQKIRSMIRWINETEIGGWQMLSVDLTGSLLIRRGDALSDIKTGQFHFNFPSEEMFQKERVLHFPRKSESVYLKQIEELEEKLSNHTMSYNHEEVVSIFKKLFDGYPEHPELLITCGNFAFEEEEYGDALSFYEKALSIDPELVEAHYNIANIYFKQEKYAASIRCFLRCIELDPEFPESYYNLGMLYIKLRAYEKAKTALTIYLHLDPDSFWAERSRQIIDDLEGHGKKEEERELFP